MTQQPSPLLILTMETDPSGFRFEREALDLGVEHRFAYYSEIEPTATPMPRLYSDEKTVILARRPYASNDVSLHYFSLLRLITDQMRYKRISDLGLYRRDYVACSDKLWIQDCFERLKLPVAPLFDWRELTAEQFPIIAKKRLAARSKANYLLNNHDDLNQFLAMYPASQFIFQKFYPLKGDYRVMVLGKRVMGIVRRKVRIKPDNRVAVKVVGKAFLPKWIHEACIKITETVGADLLGIDVGKKENGEYFFIEYNYSPQFLGFERESGINVAREMIEFMLA
jgi:hypothetical protein